MAKPRQVLAIVAAIALWPAAAPGQTSPTDPNPQAPVPVTLAPVEVIGTTPLPGTGIDVDKVPANVQTLSPSDLRREGSSNLTTGLIDQANSVNSNNALADPFQPNILYRGFEASPVLGTPQGIAVYQNGVRINEAFGDTVNWDLVPDFAIDSTNLVSSNPVYGLNALGGALLLTMKNGFTYQGFEHELAGGSFGQFSNTFQYGQQAGAFATYIGGRYFNEEGWRQFSRDNVQQLYADIGARTDKLTLDLNFTGANNRLFGQGVVPEQEYAVGHSLVFTGPQNNFNQLEFVTANGSYQVTDTLSFQANAYRREFHQTVANGNTTDFTACTSGNGLLCQSDGTTPLLDASGAPIPDISDGGAIPIGANDAETIHTVTLGGAVQTTYAGDVFGRTNNFVLGGSIDHSTIDFESTTELGVIDPSLQVEASGIFVSTPENTGFNATPVRLRATTDYYGIFATDTFNVTTDFAITASGRYNIADIDLIDRLGTNLTGGNHYNRFNPAVGGTYKLTEGLTAYFGYSEGNRVPTPSEIECSNPLQPCLLPSSLSSDPPTLKQVVSHTYETGLRGRFTAPNMVPGQFAWNFGLFRTDLFDDIYGVATSISSGFFENIGSTRRQGIEAGLSYHDAKWSAYGAYSLVDATFQSSLTLPSPNNPFADSNGNIHVTPGDHLPGIPEHQLKVGADYKVTPEWTVGATLAFFSSQYLRGDEANQNPTLPPYQVVNLHSTLTLTKNFEVFATVTNVLNSHYVTFGQYGDPTGVGAPGIPPDAVTNGPGVDNRFISPAPPISAYGGIRIKF